jgi:hypothetical protein
MKKSCRKSTLSITASLLLSSLLLPSAFAGYLPDGTVNSLGLTWTRNNSTIALTGKGDWHAANNTCNTLTAGGFTDWRLPTKQELSILFSTSINALTAAGWTLKSTWSSTKYNNDNSYYYFVDLANGNLGWTNGGSYYVTCVH